MKYEKCLVAFELLCKIYKEDVILHSVLIQPKGFITTTIEIIFIAGTPWT